MADRYLLENVNDAIRQHADVVRAHDSVHPDRNVCGGVGGCALMRTEHETLTRLTDYIESAAHGGTVLVVSRG